MGSCPRALMLTGIIAKLDYEDTSTRTMLGDLEEINNSSESGSPSQLRCDLSQ